MSEEIEEVTRYGLLAASLLAVACGGEAPGSETKAPGGEAEEIANVQVALEQWNLGCGIVPADATVPLNGGITSPNGSYNHPQQCAAGFCLSCLNSFIVDAQASDPSAPRF